ncbi:unnamed protein product, partial [Gulo gulo]
SPTLLGAELRTATASPFPTDLLSRLACLGRYLSPKMEQESKKRCLGDEGGDGRVGESNSISRHFSGEKPSFSSNSHLASDPKRCGR